MIYKNTWYSIALLFTAVFLFLGMVTVTHAATIEVNTINDSDNVPGECSLRDAINSINNGIIQAGCANISADPLGTNDRIEFNIVGEGPHTITLLQSLPVINNPITIDGLSQSDSLCGVEEGFADRDLRIAIDGNNIVDSLTALEGINISGVYFTNFNDFAVNIDSASSLSSIQCNSFVQNEFALQITNSSGGLDFDENLISLSLGNDNSSIGITNSQDISIGNNYFDNLSSGALSISSSSPIPVNPTENVVIVDNQFIDITNDVAVIELRRFSNADITGNYFENIVDGIVFDSIDNLTIGGVNPGEGNTFYEYIGNAISGGETNNLTIQGNIIGLDETGLIPQDSPAGPAINLLQNGVGTLIDSNTIYSAPEGEGFGTILITEGELLGGFGFYTDLVISNNTIGLDREGNILEPRGDGIGIHIVGAADDFLITQNTVAGIDAPAVVLTEASENPINSAPMPGTIQNVSIIDNIFRETALGILITQIEDLFVGIINITPNDAGDIDTGPNNRQNYPEIVSAEAHNDGTATITYITDFQAGEYLIEFFQDSEMSIFNTGIGETRIETATITHAGDGPETRTITLPLTEGDIVSAVTTEIRNNDPILYGNTSESGNAVIVVLPMQASSRRSSGGRVSDAYLAQAGITLESRTPATSTMTRNDRILAALSQIERDEHGRITQMSFIQFIMALIEILRQ